MGKKIKGLTSVGLLTFMLISGSFALAAESKTCSETTNIHLITEGAEKAVRGFLNLSVPSVSSLAEEEKISPALELSNKSKLPAECLIEKFPIVFQMPEIPTGCEITAMTMTLNYYGYDVDKSTMAAEYLPVVTANLHYGNDGRLYGSDLRKYFVGDPFTNAGYICGMQAVLTAANAFLQEVGSSVRAVDKSGASPDELYELVSQDTPVVVWVTIGMADRKAAQGWYTENGEYVEWSTNDHGAVLIGYSQDTVTIADPISGIVEYNKAQFESVYISRDSQCVILES